MHSASGWLEARGGWGSQASHLPRVSAAAANSRHALASKRQGQLAGAAHAISIRRLYPFCRRARPVAGGIRVWRYPPARPQLRAGLAGGLYFRVPLGGAGRLPLETTSGQKQGNDQPGRRRKGRCVSRPPAGAVCRYGFRGRPAWRPRAAHTSRLAGGSRTSAGTPALAPDHAF